MKEISHKRLYIVWLCMKCTGKSMEMESRLVVVQGEGSWEWGVMLMVMGLLFGVMKMF